MRAPKGYKPVGTTTSKGATRWTLRVRAEHWRQTGNLEASLRELIDPWDEREKSGESGTGRVESGTAQEA